MNETTRVRHREYQIVSRDGASAGHGRQCQKPPLSQADAKLSLIHCRLQVAYDADIFHRRNCMIGQVNSVLCYFGKLPSSVKSKLLYAYCSSLYGCEL